MDPFGYGARNCPGISLARKEVVFALAILFYKYRFVGADGRKGDEMDMPDKLLLGTGAARVVPLKVEKR